PAHPALPVTIAPLPRSRARSTAGIPGWPRAAPVTVLLARPIPGSGDAHRLRWRGRQWPPACRVVRRQPLDSSRENRRPEESNNPEASGGKQIDDLLNGVVGAVVGGFEFARWLVDGIWAVMEAAVGEGSAQPFVEEEEEQRYLDPFWREAVSIAGAVAL